MNDSFARNDDIRTIVTTYRDSILRLAYSYLKNRADAEDIAQEVFIAYIKHTPHCETDAKLKAWLMRVTANKCKNLLVSAWKKRTVAISDDLTYMPSENKDVLEYVLSLDQKYRIPLHLYYYEGYSIDEIARLLKAKPATVGTWLARGRKLLKDKIGDNYYE